MKGSVWFRLGGICIALAVVAGLLVWGNTAIEVTEIQVYDEDLPQVFDGFKIAHISDLHNASFGEAQSGLLDLLQTLAPDLIAVTGDLIDSNRTDLMPAMQFIRGAVELAPVYSVSGNHEARVRGDYEALCSQMAQAGAAVLENEAVSWAAGEDALTVIGVSDPRFATPDGYDAAVMTAQLQPLIQPDGGYTILLSHRPELLETYQQFGIDLVLSGHAHGGQIRLPFVGGLYAPDQGFLPRYTAGLYQMGKTQMVVSRGLGNSVFPLRIDNRPEVVLITLHRS